MTDRERIRELEARLTRAEAALTQTREENQVYKRFLRENALASILQGKLPEPGRVSAFLKQYEIRFDSDCFVVALLSPDEKYYYEKNHIPATFQSSQELGERVRTMCQKYLQPFQRFHVTVVQSAFVLIIPVEDMAPERDGERVYKVITRCNTCITNVVRELSDAYSLPCKAAISFPVTGIGKLCFAYEHAKAMLEKISDRQRIVDNYTMEGVHTDADAPNGRFFLEQRYYTFCISHNSAQACQVLRRIFQDSRDRETISFSQLLWDIRRYLAFLMNTLGITLYSVHDASSADLMRCYIDMSECRDYGALWEGLCRFSSLVARYTERFRLEERDKSDAAQNYIRISGHTVRSRI